LICCGPEPELLLLDEPAGSLDPAARSRLYELLSQLNDRITILMISHDLTVVSTYVKTVGCLNRRLFYERGRQLTAEMLNQVYGCPVDLLAHGLPHRVLPEHPPASVSR
jgi:zinc transport system ATP-binding protein